ncbi:hypothetical protein H3C61_02995 [Candidatus Gracilibacteria bacterium]|nr:hypothetical protein [Candidatus Gracilibacteria bacterium]
MKKIIFFLFFFIFFFYHIFIYSNQILKEDKLYYLDLDNNLKIDTLEIEFNQSLTGNLDLSKLQLQSATGGLLKDKKLEITGSDIVSSYSFSGNILTLNLIEQYNYLTGLIINNGQTSHLRLKNNTGFGLKDDFKFSLTTSFDNYKNVFFKENSNIIVNTNSGELNDPTSNTPIEDEEDETGSGVSGPIEDEDIDNQNDDIEEQTNSGTTNSGIINNEIIPNFLIKNTLQSPTYFLETDETSTIFNCDNSKTECKANFSLQINEGSGFINPPTTKYNCLFKFGSGLTTNEEEKCNPNTIIYPIGEYETTFKIFLKTNPNIFLEKKFIVKNTGYIAPITTQTVYINNNSSTQNNQNIEIKTPTIEIQSGLFEDNTCKSNSCSVNFIYNKLNEKESCLWDFGLPNKTLEEEKCNPSYIKYDFIGEYKIKLKVYETSNPNNYKENEIIIKNISYLKNDTKTKKENLENKEVLKSENIKKTDIPQLNYTLDIKNILPTPEFGENLEYIEIENTGEIDLDLGGCLIDDLENGGSKAYTIPNNTIIKAKNTYKFYKDTTKLILNNSGLEEVNLTCFDNFFKKVSWNFSPPKGFILSNNLDLENIESVKINKKTGGFDIKYKNNEIKNINFNKNDILKEILESSLSNTEKKEKVLDIYKKSFEIKTSKLKSGIKIIGNTFPNTKLIIEIKKIENEFSFLDFFINKSYAFGEYYEVLSDNLGNFELVLDNNEIKTGYFEVSSFLNISGEKINLEKFEKFEIDGDYIDYIQTKKEEVKDTKDYVKPKAVISLQGKLTINKVLEKNKVTCFDLDECSINFDGSESEGKKLKYFWDFGNGQTFDKKNPSSYKFTPGTYFISLVVSDESAFDKASFIVEVKGKLKEEAITTTSKTTKIDNNFNEIKQKKEEIINTNFGNSGNNNIILHIYISLGIFILFFTGTLFLLKKQDII